MKVVKPYHKPKEVVFSRRQLSGYSIILLILLTIFPLVNTSGSVGNFTRSVFSYWIMADKDFGKLKFVNFQEESSTVILSSSVLEFKVPFPAAVIERTKNGECKVCGNSDMLKAVASGNVVDIKKVGNEKIITIDHGDGLKSIYQFDGLFCVKKGDRVDGDYIGIAKQKNIILTITRGNDILKINGILGERLDVTL